jgi:biotin synthase
MFIEKIMAKIFIGEQINLPEALLLYQEDLHILLNVADKIRQKFCGDAFDFCSIINAKSGCCSEDCKYCAQSRHYNTQIEVFPLLAIDEILARAIYDESSGIKRFSLVTSGKVLPENDFVKILDIYRTLRAKTKLQLCASLGIISYEQAVALKNAGVTRYHHNLEVCRSYFAKTCTTHTYEDRVIAIKNAKKADLEICCGGIFGVGESFLERISLAFELRDLDVKSIPINILIPIKGTPLGDMHSLAAIELVKSIVIFRFVLPDAIIRLAGGRQQLGDNILACLQGGVNALLTGDYLTTTGNKTKDDFELVKSSGYMLA